MRETSRPYGDTTTLWARHHTHPTPDTRNALAAHYAPLATITATRLHEAMPTTTDATDLTVRGITGLLDAIDAYTPDHTHVPFETFAPVRIRHTILADLRDATSHHATPTTRPTHINLWTAHYTAASTRTLNNLVRYYTRHVYAVAATAVDRLPYQVSPTDPDLIRAGLTALADHIQDTHPTPDTLCHRSRPDQDPTLPALTATLTLALDAHLTARFDTAVENLNWDVLLGS